MVESREDTRRPGTGSEDGPWVSPEELSSAAFCRYSAPKLLVRMMMVFLKFTTRPCESAGGGSGEGRGE